VQRAHDRRHERGQAEQELPFFLELAQEVGLLVALEPRRNLQALERDLGAEASVVRAIDHREAALGHHGLDLEDLRLHGADDPEYVVRHCSAHDTPITGAGPVRFGSRELPLETPDDVAFRPIPPQLSGALASGGACGAGSRTGPPA
jgi:hypothetical protein